MAIEQNKAVIRRVIEEGLNQKNADVLDELYADDFVNHDAPPGFPNDREGLKQIFTAFGNAFPDLRVSIDDLVGEGEKVVLRCTVRGTHKGQLMDMEPTGNKVEFPFIGIVRFANGKGVERWGVTDTMSMMQQLGVIPTPEQSKE